MKAIKNQQNLALQLANETSDWQKLVYNATSVIPVSCKDSSITLFGACGYIDLSDDAVYRYSKNQDATDYCEILSVQELISYILAMESYQNILVDESLGLFSKSELFWGIWSTLISPKTNQQRPDGSCTQDWGLYHIQLYNGHIDLHMPLIEYNDCSLWIDHIPHQSLSEALEAVAIEMNKVTEDLEEIPIYRVLHGELQAPPSSFEDLYSKLQPGGEFDWLV